MKNYLMNFLKWIAFTILSIIIPGIISLGILSLTKYLMSLDLNTWFIIFIFIAGIGANFTLPIILSLLIGFFISSICPNSKAGGILFSVTSLSFYFFLLLHMWTLPDKYAFATILILIIMSISVITIGGYSIAGILENN